MKKLWLIVISIAIIASFIAYSQINLNGPSQESNFEDFRAMYPDDTGIRIYCTNGNSRTDCTNRTTFMCGETIEFTATVVNVGNPFYSCVNLTIFGMPLICSDKTIEPFLFWEPPITVPNLNGEYQFMEVLWFPDRNYSTLDDFFFNINASKKIVNITRIITC